MKLFLPYPALLILLCVTSLQAQSFTGAPDSLSYQGLLTDNAGIPVADATYTVAFTLYDAPAPGTALWTETQSVATSKGLYNVMLGSVTTLADVAFDKPLWLGVKVNAEPEMMPRTVLASAPYALSLRNLRIEPETAGDGPNVVGGWSGNTVSASIRGATIAGGGDPDHLGDARPNRVTGHYSTVGGGSDNTAGDYFSTVGGGFGNTADGSRSTVGGGEGNTASLTYSTVCGGWNNRADGSYSTVPGGLENAALGHASFAAGHDAKAIHNGSFVWNDQSITTGNDSLVSTGPNQFLIRAAGGVGIGTASPSAQLTVHGNVKIDSAGAGLIFPDGTKQISSGLSGHTATETVNLNANYLSGDGDAEGIFITSTGKVGIGNNTPLHPLVVGTDNTNGNKAYVSAGGVWTNASSRLFKEDFTPVDVRALLEQVAALSIMHWRYKDESGVLHLGPVAEEFHTAFGLGSDAQHIGTVDADGVAFAAIQGLYLENQKKDRQIKHLEDRLSKLEHELEQLLAQTK